MGKRTIKIEGDAGTDPIWCNQFGCNLAKEDLPLSHELALAIELSTWVMANGEWIDWEQDRLTYNGMQLTNESGFKLTEK